MEIINSTVYNTDDIRAFWGWSRKLAVHIYKNNESGYYRSQHARELPKKLTVGYYARTPKDQLKDRLTKGGVEQGNHKFIRWNEPKWVCNRDCSPRLGIVRPAKLYDSPLEQLAAVAEDQMYAPAQLITELSEVTAAWFSMTSSFEKEQWEIISSFRMRYTDRAKRGSRKTAVENAKKKRLASIKERYRKCDNTIYNARQTIEKGEVTKLELKKQYNKLCEQLGIPTYERYI